jgi:uncharacterized protein (DUF488 family)
MSAFVDLFSKHAVELVCDVRSTPFSRFDPQFNRGVIEGRLRQRGIQYLFLGYALGARPKDPNVIVDGKVSYERLAHAGYFLRGLSHVCDLAQKQVLALMCCEKDPIDCHRTILVARRLVEAGRSVQHIRDTGEVESHEQAMARLVERLGIKPTLFCPNLDVISTAYQVQENRIACKTRTSQDGH